MKGTAGGVTTAYVGNYPSPGLRTGFEWTGSTSTMVRYYYAGSQRVAMRVGSTLYYLLSDHPSLPLHFIQGIYSGQDLGSTTMILRCPFVSFRASTQDRSLRTSGQAANSSGVEYGELRYPSFLGTGKAWGEQRYTSGTTPSARHFTGQLLENSLGLYYYGARF